MKKLYATIAAVLLTTGLSVNLQAQDFEVPEPTFTVPFNGEAELLYNMFQVTWGYYGITDNMGDEPMECTLTMPDGTVKTLKGSISDANMEGTIEGDAPATSSNALSFRNFMSINDDTMQLIQMYGTYKVNIPEATVLVNGVPNPEANMQFIIYGENGTGAVNEINVENGVYKVFSIDGTKVTETSDVNVVKGLSPGIYVINGKKTLIKK